ncbi:hypothetical protein C4A75_02905 [Brevibacillus laterosporus]|nr:hypothetical protein C4A75_02905 [Brevibacillus laterosporus]
MNYSKNKIWSNVWVCLAFCFFYFCATPLTLFIMKKKKE